MFISPLPEEVQTRPNIQVRVEKGRKEGGRGRKKGWASMKTNSSCKTLHLQIWTRGTNTSNVPWFCQRIPALSFYRESVLKYTEASLYVDSEWNNNTNNIILKQKKQKLLQNGSPCLTKNRPSQLHRSPPRGVLWPSSAPGPQRTDMRSPICARLWSPKTTSV